MSSFGKALWPGVKAWYGPRYPTPLWEEELENIIEDTIENYITLIAKHLIVLENTGAEEEATERYSFGWTPPGRGVFGNE